MRTRGYLVGCVGVLASLAAVGAGAFISESSPAAPDPSWTFWVGESVLVALLLRAPLVGVVVDRDRIVRRGWLRNRSWAIAEVSAVGFTNYSGLLNMTSMSTTLLMLRLELNDGSTVDVPEVMGRPAPITNVVQTLRRRLSMPPPSAPGNHRPDETPERP